MEKEQSKRTLKGIGIFLLLMSLLVVYKGSYTDLVDEKTTCAENDKRMLSTSVKEISTSCKSLNADIVETNDKEATSIKKEVVGKLNEVTTIEPVETMLVEEEVYDGLTLTELTNKLNRSLNSTMANKGYIFANYTKETGLDPYLAVAIVLEETGCRYTCSHLVNACHNVGGIKGSGNCNGYQGYKSLDEGIKSYLNFLYNNYYAKGLTTPENINPSYAESTTWAAKINNYIDYVKSN